MLIPGVAFSCSNQSGSAGVLVSLVSPVFGSERIGMAAIERLEDLEIQVGIRRWWKEQKQRMWGQQASRATRTRSNRRCQRCQCTESILPMEYR